MTPESRDLHGAAEDERARMNREKRISDKATAEAHALAARRLQVLLAIPNPIASDFPGCYE